MATQTPNYGFTIPEGTDVVNLLTQNYPNFTSLDTILRNIANTGITSATELKSGTVHALTRTDQNVSFIRFEATSNFTAGETFTVDGVQVTALNVAGETLRTGAYIIGSMVLCELRDTLLTVYTSGSSDAQTLEGHSAAYFGTAASVTVLENKVNELSYPIFLTLQGWAAISPNDYVDITRVIDLQANESVINVKLFSNTPLLLTAWSLQSDGIHLRVYNLSNQQHALDSTDYLEVYKMLT